MPAVGIPGLSFVILGLDPRIHSAISPDNVMCGWITEWILGSGAEDDEREAPG